MSHQLHLKLNSIFNDLSEGDDGKNKKYSPTQHLLSGFSHARVLLASLPAHC